MKIVRLVVVVFAIALFLGAVVPVSADGGNLRIDVRRTDGSLGGGNWAEPGECRVEIDGNTLSNAERSALNSGDRVVDFGDGVIRSYSGDQVVTHNYRPGIYRIVITKDGTRVSSVAMFLAKVEVGPVSMMADHGRGVSSKTYLLPQGGQAGVVVADHTWFGQGGVSESSPAYLAVNGRVAPNQQISNPGTIGRGLSSDVLYLSFGGPGSVTLTLHPPSGGWASFTSSGIVLYYLPEGSPRPSPDGELSLEPAYNVVAQGQKAGDVLIILQDGQPQIRVDQDGEWRGWHGIRGAREVQLWREVPGEGWKMIARALVVRCGGYDVNAEWQFLQ